MEKYTFKCKDCGSKTYKKEANTYVCSYCGYREEVHFFDKTEKKPLQSEEQKEVETRVQSQVVIKNQNADKENDNIKKEEKENKNRIEKIVYGILNKNLLNLLVCLLFGTLGVHKFIEGKYTMGILYIFTFGLFGIGYVIDIVSYAIIYIGSIINGLIG